VTVLLRAPDRVYGGYVLDLDGTVYLGEELLPGAAEVVRDLRATGAEVVFVTNRPLQTAADYAEKLTRLGIPTRRDEVVTALDALVHYLREHHAGETLMPVAELLVHRVLGEAGFALTGDPRAADLVVLSFDRTFDYAKLLAAYRAVTQGGAAIVATNPDPYCPTPDGGLPDCGAILAALEACTGARAEAVVGKPSSHMAATFLDRLHVPAADVAVVGDRLLTDVQMGQSLCMVGILVLSGATTLEAIPDSAVQPDYVLSGIHELLADPQPEPAR
jgi:HAD superfamily hydrolase (TIGR01450 family)